MMSLLWNLHIPWQLSCHDRCKFVTLRDHYNHNQGKNNLHKIQLWAHKPFVKWFHGSFNYSIQTTLCTNDAKIISYDGIFCALNKSPYLHQYWLIINKNLAKKLWWNQNTVIFIYETAFEHVICKMSAVSFRPQSANGNWSMSVSNFNSHFLSLSIEDVTQHQESSMDHDVQSRKIKFCKFFTRYRTFPIRRSSFP